MVQELLLYSRKQIRTRAKLHEKTKAEDKIKHAQNKEVVQKEDVKLFGHRINVSH